MSAFIVLGTESRLTEIVDGIAKYHLLNSEVFSFISSGVIEEKNNSLYYNFSCYDKGVSIRSNNDCQEGKNLKDILANQLAYLRHVAITESQGASINIFLITNPLIDKDFDRIKYVISEIEGLNDKTIRLMTVLLSYDLNNYGDVTLRPNKELLKSFMQEYQCSCLPENIDFRKDMLFLNNLDMSNAVVTFDSPRIAEVLNIYFMLLSNASDCYHANSSLTGPIFSIGYADYLYNFTDLSRYFICSLKKDLLIELFSTDNFNPNELVSDRLSIFNELLKDKWLNINNPCDSLDVRIENMKLVFTDIDYWKNPDSSFYNISLVKYQDDIIQELRQVLPNNVKYVDWRMIYEAGIGDKSLLSLHELENVYELINDYNVLKGYLASDEALDDIISSFKEKRNKERTEDIQEEVMPLKKMSFIQKILKFFGLYNANKREVVNNIVEKSKDNSYSEREIRESIKAFKDSFKLKDQYITFVDYSKSVKDELNKSENDVKNFKLTEFSKSIPMIDHAKLSSFYLMHAKSIIEKIKSDLSNNQENVNGYINSMNNIIHNSVFEFTKEWRLLDWENLSKFEFIKTLDDSLLTDVTNRIQLLSSPFVACDQTTSESQFTNISRKLYCNSKGIIDKFIEKKLDNIQNANAIEAIKSNHIENRICFFQIYNFDDISILHDCKDTV